MKNIWFLFLSHLTRRTQHVFKLNKAAVRYYHCDGCGTGMIHWYLCQLQATQTKQDFYLIISLSALAACDPINLFGLPRGGVGVGGGEEG